MKVLRAPRMERCIGCHSCSLACARQVYKKLSWHTAGIRIRSSGGLSTGYEPQMCLACNPAPCAIACPTGAYTQRPGGGVRVKIDLCDKCGACAEACPVDAIYMAPETGLPHVCLHCGRCVPFCPHECLEMEEVGNEVKPGSKTEAKPGAVGCAPTASAESIVAAGGNVPSGQAGAPTTDAGETAGSGGAVGREAASGKEPEVLGGGANAAKKTTTAEASGKASPEAGAEAGPDARPGIGPKTGRNANG